MTFLIVLTISMALAMLPIAAAEYLMKPEAERREIRAAVTRDVELLDEP